MPSPESARSCRWRLENRARRHPTGSYADVMTDVIGQVRDAVVDVFGGRRVVCIGGVLAGAGPLVAELRAAGASRVLLMPSSVGTGPLPEGDDIEVVMLDPEPAPTATGQFRAEERVCAAPPAELVETVRRFFGGAEPLLLAQAFAAVRSFGAFPVYGGRRAEWVALGGQDGERHVVRRRRSCPSARGRRPRRSRRRRTRPAGSSTAAWGRCGRATRVKVSTAAPSSCAGCATTSRVGVALEYFAAALRPRPGRAVRRRRAVQHSRLRGRATGSPCSVRSS